MRALGLLSSGSGPKGHGTHTSEMDRTWKRVICFKYGTKEFGWKPKEARGPYGAGLWKDITKEVY